jgi:beta-mannosidase
MKIVSLDGAWKVHQKGGSDRIDAVVPGCIHTDLLAAGSIEDPYYSDNEKQLLWIGETDWIYERSFELPPDFLKAGRVDLVCEGLDTLADIRLNGRSVAKADNAFRTWRFDAGRFLRAGKNTIEIVFASTIPVINRAQKKRYLKLTGVGHHRIDGSNQIRKSQCNYGWDWGPMCVTAGIWRPIRLEAVETARLTTVSIRQDHRRKGSVALDIACEVEQIADTSLKAKATVRFEGQQIETSLFPILEKKGSTRIRIPKAKLWWPNGLGEQPLYEVVVELIDAAEKKLDTAKRSVGLRTLELERKPDKWGESFQFSVNGKPFFAKGANWIPADTFVTRLGEAEYEALVKSATDANMNMLRVWGGGIYEDDQFYDLCDRYGICIWQDFMFACSAYPADDDYVASVEAEATDNIKRIAHHASLALWCGNNEIEQMQSTLIGNEKGQMTWAEYSQIFDELLPGLVKKYDPDRPYWPSSPHTPGEHRDDFNSPNSGDAHLWSVWHGRQPFEWYRTCEHRFNSEFGFQSFPEPEVVRGYTSEDERNITSYTMEHHQRSGIGNDAILQYMLSWFRLPSDFDRTLWLSQILQGMAIKYAVEHWRRKMPQGMGTLYWQINDCWPVASWSSIDYFGNWKALHYMAREFYAPVLVSAVEHLDTNKVEIHLTNDHRSPREGIVGWTLFHTDGRLLGGERVEAKIAGLKSARVLTLDLAGMVKEYGPRNVVLSIDFSIDRERVSSNLATFVRPKHLTLSKPDIATRMKRTQDALEVTLESNAPALWCRPEVPGIRCDYSDRFFHLMPGVPVTVTITPASGVTADIEALERSFVVSSLRDTYV